MRRASERISTTSAELISCANRVAQEGGGAEEEEEEADPQLLDHLHETLESTELLRRDWASQVHTYMSYYLSRLGPYIPSFQEAKITVGI